jgi:RNA polymerase sigma-70 factor (ECF subfamily)
MSVCKGVGDNGRIQPNVDEKRRLFEAVVSNPTVLLRAIQRVAPAQLEGRLEARDILHGACVVAIRRLESFHGSCEIELRAWLLEIARRLGRNEARREESSLSALEGLGLKIEYDFDAVSHEAAEIFERRERQALVRAAVAQLPSELRVLVQLHWLEGTPIATLASRFGVKPGTLHTRLWRAKLLLKDALGGDIDQPASALEARLRRRKAARQQGSKAASGANNWPLRALSPCLGFARPQVGHFDSSAGLKLLPRSAERRRAQSNWRFRLSIGAVLAAARLRLVYG